MAYFNLQLFFLNRPEQPVAQRQPSQSTWEFTVEVYPVPGSLAEYERFQG